MADAITTSSSSRGGTNVGAMADKYAEINEALDTAEKGLVESGLYDAQTARALFVGIRPPMMENVVGNLADLQRQPLMPPGFEQGAMESANPFPTAVQEGAPVEALGRTEKQKLEDYGVDIPETPATSDEAIERMSKPLPGAQPTVIDDSDGSASTTQTPGVETSTAETPQSEAPQSEAPQEEAPQESLSGMTKAELQDYANRRGIPGVDQSTQTRDEMLDTIQGE